MSRRRRDKRILFVILGAFVAVFLFTFLTQKFKGSEDTEAASLAGFDPGYIISDYQMSNYNSMSEAEIQNFLKQKGNCNDTRTYLASYYTNYSYHIKDGHFVCLADETFGDGTAYGDSAPGGASAAHIIWQAAQDYKINPQVLIVLLQKEQGLITDSWPNDRQYKTATGYGCPDTAPCSSQYYGFKNQVRKAAALFRTVLDGGWTNYPLGNNYIQYNPDADCGGGVVNIRSLATSALYRYTPYQPNAGALAAGYGTAHCGAYGNRNFYLYFEDWFGGITSEYIEKLGRTIPDGKYQITSKKYNNRSFDIYGGIRSEMNSERVILYQTKENSASNQTFMVKYNDASGYYMIYNEDSGLYLDLENGSLVINKKNGDCGQKWNIKRENKLGYYMLVSACDGKSLVSLSENEIGIRNSAVDNDGVWKFFEVSPETHELEDGTYQILTVLSDKMAIDIKGGVVRGMESGEINLWNKKSPNGTIANQLFDVEYDSETGFYKIKNHSTGLLLDVYNGNVENGTKVIVWRENGGCNQRWMIKKIEGDYEIVSACTGKALDVPKNNAVVGQSLIIYNRQGSKNQKWNFEPISEEKVDLEKNTYTIAVSEDRNMVLDVSGGVNKNLKYGELIMYKKKIMNNANQTFKFKKSGIDSGYFIYNPESNLYLDVYNGGVDNGSRVILWQYNGGCNQRWYLERTMDGYYQITSACSKKVLDVDSGRIDSLAPVIIYGNHSGSNQKWLFTEIKD